jgi:hypothetical protein
MYGTLLDSRSEAMASTYRSKPVTYWVTEPVELESGVTLPEGRYKGLMEAHGMETFKGVSWGKPRYNLERTAEQLIAMGRKEQRNVDSISYDLAKFVAGGQIDVT